MPEPKKKKVPEPASESGFKTPRTKKGQPPQKAQEHKRAAKSTTDPKKKPKTPAPQGSQTVYVEKSKDNPGMRISAAEYAKLKKRLEAADKKREAGNRLAKRRTAEKKPPAMVQVLSGDDDDDLESDSEQENSKSESSEYGPLVNRQAVGNLSDPENEEDSQGQTVEEDASGSEDVSEGE